MAVNIIDDKCKGCQKCLKSCPFNAITMEGKLAVIGPSCTSCGACVEVCPFDAIEKTDEAVHTPNISSYHNVWVFAEQREGKLMSVFYRAFGRGSQARV